MTISLSDMRNQFNGAEPEQVLTVELTRDVVTFNFKGSPILTLSPTAMQELSTRTQLYYEGDSSKPSEIVLR